MKLFRRPLFKALVAALFAGTAVPSWACVRNCDRDAPSLSCVRLCAHSKALLTGGGKLAAIGADACSVAAVDAAPTLSAPEFNLQAPDLAVLAPIDPAVRPELPLLAAAAVSRGPPLPSSYLSSDHPFANAPPTLL